ncbi:MAG: RloB domain-containing protein [Wenzhouxiangella sp.]|nr:MAG: RloB domain-containing protein [Wenzhouxiangella sp.]
MGSDDLFRKRRAQEKQALKRRHYRRARYEKVLIVCEGGKTEPQYFNELRDFYRLQATNVVISGDCGSDPMSVYRTAKDVFARHSNAGDPFNRVYCVFDQDSHAGYQPALNAITSARPAGVWQAITSVPCFEFWVLLHHTYTTQAFRPAGPRSGCQQLIRTLGGYLPNYAKGQAGLFERLHGQLDFAIANAERALQHAQATGTDNPTTSVHKLVEYLRNLALENR